MLGTSQRVTRHPARPKGMWSLTGIDGPVNTGISHSLFLGHFVGCFLSFHCFYPVLPAPSVCITFLFTILLPRDPE